METYQNEISSSPISCKKLSDLYEIKSLLIRIGVIVILIIAHFLLPITTLKVKTISYDSDFGGVSFSGKVHPAGNGILSFSLSKLAFYSNDNESFYDTDIYDSIFSDFKKTYKAVISAVLAISCICIAVCAAFVIKSVFHIVKKNFGKAIGSIAMALIPLILVDLSLITLIIANINYAQPNASLGFDIIGNAYPSLFFVILFAATIQITVNSVKASHCS